MLMLEKQNFGVMLQVGDDIYIQTPRNANVGKP